MTPDEEQKLKDLNRFYRHIMKCPCVICLKKGNEVLVKVKDLEERLKKNEAK